MKPTILKLSTLFLFLLFIGASCQNDEDLFELQIGDENAIIQKEVNGIEFKFCLLNEAGEPATIFNEGENFTFQFSIKNNTTENLPFNNENVKFIYLKDFFAVRSDQKYYGKPKLYDFDENTYPDTAILHWLFSGATQPFSDTWINNEEENTRSNETSEVKLNSPLKKGNYFTQFSYQFEFGEIKTEKLTFKINFEIK